MNDSPIGQVIIPIHYLTDKVGQRDCRYHQLTKVTDFSKPAGEIKAELAIVQANFDPYQQQQPQQQQQMVDPYGFPVSPGFDFAQAHMQQPQQPQHSRQHSRQPPPPSQQQPVTLNRGDMLDGKYRVERLLGKGNFGTAYLATSEVDDQQYAVKLILCKRDSDLSTIKSEAKILFRMLHDNIVRYFSSFIHIDHLGQKYFGMVMEFCENQDIQCHINRYKKHHLHISDRRIVRWTLEIAEALEYMHAKGLQHRDLKADNVMVRGEKAKVADFGLATAKGSLRGQVGALAYESPEQANHKPYDGRNDIWALGCLVTEMITGKMVFRRVKPGAVFALEPDAVKATIDECAARSPDWGRFVAWLLNEDVTLRPTAAFVVKTLKPIVAELYSPSESSEEVKSPSKGAGTAPPPPDTQEDGDAPPPSYEESQPQPKQPVLRFPEIVMEPVPAPTKLEVDERRAPSTNSSPQRHDGSHSPSSPATAASRQPTSGQRPAQAAFSPRQPPATRPPPAAQTQPAFRGPPVASQYSLPNAEPVPNHRSPWMDEMEMALVTYYSQHNPDAMGRVQQKVADVAAGVVAPSTLARLLSNKYGAVPNIGHIKPTRAYTIRVEVPAGCGPGSSLGITSPHTGRELRVTVPEGFSPGMAMSIIEEIPIPEPQQQTY